MAYRATQRFCRACNRPVLAQQHRPNHILHLLLSLCTLGFWIPAWIIMSVHRSAPRCPHCGSKRLSWFVPRQTPAQPQYVVVPPHPMAQLMPPQFAQPEQIVPEPSPEPAFPLAAFLVLVVLALFIASAVLKVLHQ